MRRGLALIAVVLACAAAGAGLVLWLEPGIGTCAYVLEQALGADGGPTQQAPAEWLPTYRWQRRCLAGHVGASWTIPGARVREDVRP